MQAEILHGRINQLPHQRAGTIAADHIARAVLLLAGINLVFNVQNCMRVVLLDGKHLMEQFDLYLGKAFNPGPQNTLQCWLMKVPVIGPRL